LNWAYVPALRRVREVSPANRSDGFLGSDISQDDASFFDGKVTNFDFKLVGEGEMLCVADPVSLAGIYPKRIPSPQYPGGWRDFMSPDKGASGFMKADWKGVPWAPADQALVLGPVRVEHRRARDFAQSFGRPVEPGCPPRSPRRRSQRGEPFETLGDAERVTERLTQLERLGEVRRGSLHVVHRQRTVTQVGQ